MAEHLEDHGEISLSDIFWRLWAGRGIIVIAPLLAIGLAALYVAMTALSQSRPAIYLIDLHNIENQRYPNGTAFSPQDLVIPEVLGALRTRFDIAEGASLRNAITVAYDSPIAAGIARTYQERISARNLSQAEIETINEAYRQELRNAMRSSLRITVDYRSLGVDDATGIAIAAALPQVWTDVYTTRFRIFADRRVADLAVSRTQEDLSTTASILVAHNRINAMRLGLDAFVEDNRLAMLTTSEGMSPTDLQIELQRFETTWFNAVKAARMRSGDTVADSYLRELRLDIAERQRRVDAYDATLADVREYQRRGQVPTHVMEQPPLPGDRLGALQVGDTALSEIMHLAERASFVNFVQETLRSRRTLMFEISELTRELELTTDSREISTSTQFQTEAAELLQDLTRQYLELVAIAESRLRDRGGTLFEPAVGPSIGGSLISPRNVLVLAASGLAAGLLAIIGVLLWSGMRPRRAQGSAT